MNKYYDIEWCKPQRFPGLLLLGWRLRALGDQIQPKVRASGSLSVRKIMSISCSRLRMKLDMQSAHDALGRAPSSTWVGSFSFPPHLPPHPQEMIDFHLFALLWFQKWPGQIRTWWESPSQMRWKERPWVQGGERECLSYSSTLEIMRMPHSSTKETGMKMFLWNDPEV